MHRVLALGLQNRMFELLLIQDSLMIAGRWYQDGGVGNRTITGDLFWFNV